MSTTTDTDGAARGGMLTAKTMLVEDNAINRVKLARRLQWRGHELPVDGVQRLAVAQAQRPDLILMDVSLPVLDGWEVARTPAADLATGNIPVIALTAHAMTEDRERVLEAACDDYGTRPVELARLVGKIDVLLGTSA